MLDKRLLIEAIRAKGYRNYQIAEYLEMTPKTFSFKINHHGFTMDEAAAMSKLLDIRDPAKVFLAEE